MTNDETTLALLALVVRIILTKRKEKKHEER